MYKRCKDNKLPSQLITLMALLAVGTGCGSKNGDGGGGGGAQFDMEEGEQLLVLQGAGAQEEAGDFGRQRRGHGQSVREFRVLAPAGWRYLMFCCLLISCHLRRRKWRLQMVQLPK